MNPEPAAETDLLTHAVTRPHLLAQLDAGGRGPLTVVVAPPDYGKSVLLAQWADSLRGPHIWLRLDQQDREIPRLGSGLTAGTTVVMDDFDFVSRSARHEAWNAVMKLCQQGLHVVIGSRTRPELTAAGLAAIGDVTVLSARELALRIDEARELLEVVSGRDLTDPRVPELPRRTEGWAAGLQLAAMALRDHDDVDGFVDAFAGDDRHVAMYLTDQVLAAQPSTIRRFLLRTSILDRLNGWVCNAVTGDEDGHQMLELLEHQSMFINRLDGPVTAFRCHRLFQDFLRHQRGVDEPENERVLLLRAELLHAVQDGVGAAAAYL